jgi:hypothetical protein
MENLLTIWAALYAPATGIVGIALAMRTLWGDRASHLAVYVAAAVFIVMGVAWELTTYSPWWLRALNGIFAAITVAVVFPKILESLCQTSTSSDSQ